MRQTGCLWRRFLNGKEGWADGWTDTHNNLQKHYECLFIHFEDIVDSDNVNNTEMKMRYSKSPRYYLNLGLMNVPGTGY